MPGPCALCSASCCRDYVVTITSFDALRIMEKTGMEFREFAELAPLRILNFDNDTVLECYRKRLGYEYLLALKSHPCIFLEKGRCTIHGFAPYVCRIYPHNSAGKMAGRARCPIIARVAFILKGPGGKLEGYRRQILGYKKIVAKWNRKKGSREECAEFLLAESKKTRI